MDETEATPMQIVHEFDEFVERVHPRNVKHAELAFFTGVAATLQYLQDAAKLPDKDHALLIYLIHKFAGRKAAAMNGDAGEPGDEQKSAQI